jgi:hypothetical protein
MGIVFGDSVGDWGEPRKRLQWCRECRVVDAEFSTTQQFACDECEVNREKRRLACTAGPRERRTR